jgi:two-component system OmpR family response regulator
VKQTASATTPRVLIVDDHGTSRQFMLGILRQAAVAVREASSADEAKRLALDWLPHVMLLDVRLAGEDGYSTARHIRRHWPPNRPFPRTIMMSADPPESPSFPAITTRADAFLIKPFTARQLLHAVLGTDQSSPLAPVFDDSASGALRGLFRTELASRLEALERYLARRDLVSAQGVLHQLIASSALCRQRRLERDLRRLYAACNEPTETPAVARGYFAVLASARDWLGRP